MRLFVLLVLLFVSDILCSQNLFGNRVIDESNYHIASAKIKAIPNYWDAFGIRGISEELPSFVDNSKSSYFPPVIEQMGNSCVSVSMIYYLLSYEKNAQLNQKATIENSFSYYYNYNFVNNGVDIGTFPWDVAEAGTLYGSIPISDYHTTSLVEWMSGYQEYYKASNLLVGESSKFVSDKVGHLQQMKQYLFDKGTGSATGGLIQFSAFAHPFEPLDYKNESESGYASIIPVFGNNGMHSMVIVGYDDSVWWDYNEDGQKDEDEIGAFICVNSWGIEWGDQGKFYAPYRTFSEDMPWWDGGTGNAGKECYVISFKENTSGKVLSIKLRHSSREKIYFEVFAYDSQNKLLDQREISQFNLIGGDFPMRGTDENENDLIEIGLDISFVPDEAKKYVVKLNTMGGEGEFLECKLYDYRVDENNPLIFESEIEDSILEGFAASSAEILLNPQMQAGITTIYNYLIEENDLIINVWSKEDAFAVIDILSLDGSEVGNLYRGDFKEGYTSKHCELGNEYLDGEYLLRININNQVEYKKITL